MSDFKYLFFTHNNKDTCSRKKLYVIHRIHSATSENHFLNSLSDKAKFTPQTQLVIVGELVVNRQVVS